VRRLVKVAKECKRAHTGAIEKPKASPQPKSVSDSQESPKAHLLGERFAKAIKKPTIEEEDSDLELDFLPCDANAEALKIQMPRPCIRGPGLVWATGLGSI
jgi:Gdp/GTP exchange factor required for growth at low temperatures